MTFFQISVGPINNSVEYRCQTIPPERREPVFLPLAARTGYTFRETNPSRSKFRNVWMSIFCVIPTNVPVHLRRISAFPVFAAGKKNEDGPILSAMRSSVFFP